VEAGTVVSYRRSYDAAAREAPPGGGIQL